MKMKFLLLTMTLSMILLPGCAANKINEPAFENQKQSGIKSHADQDIQRKKALSDQCDGSLSHHSQVKKMFRVPVHDNFKTSKSTPLLKDGFAIVAYSVEQQPIIQTAPFQITVIQLEPGEQFTNISSGDPSRWSYAVAVSGSGELAQQNILVKPSQPDISTNLVITTDKRLYNLRLTATQTDKPTRNVNFWYPEKVKTKCDTVCWFEEKSIEEKQNKIPAQCAVHCHYRITTPGFFSRPPAWQPVRVFDDGVHTTIQFPDNIAQRNLPALFIINHGQKECVNYRFKSPYIVVDKIFEQASLLSGVGRSQQAVILTNLCY